MHHSFIQFLSAAALMLLLMAPPATAQSEPKAGGTLRMAVTVDPATLNPYFAGFGLERLQAQLNLEGLARVAPDGSYVPVLASEIPTQANGDVSPDGRVVTWRLKSGVTWSDGQPFGSQDVVFTYRMLTDPANPVPNRVDYTVISSVVAPDDATVVVTYNQLFAPYRTAFPYVLPAHVFNGQTDLAQSPFNQAPTVGTGPFVFKSWSAGDSITFQRNPNYHEVGKPYLDQVILKTTPDRDVAIQALETGDVDAVWNMDASYIPTVTALQDVDAQPTPNSVQELFLNRSCPSGAQQGDPACPHPMLADLRVRQAIELAIDKQALVHGLMFDRVSVAASPLPIGPFAVNLPASEFNPDKAQHLLDEAGWTMGIDGIRSRGGVRAHLSFIHAAGNRLAEQTAQVIEGYLQAVGIETDARALPPSVLTGGIAVNSPLALGNFDLALLLRPIPVDPQAYLYSQFVSDQVPSPQHQTGNNWDRVQDPAIDQELIASGNTVDDGQRQAAYTKASELITADEAVIPLYPILQVDVRKTYVQGWGPSNANDFLTWNVSDWWLNQ
jgi:peptide/nickel transport system substrate-binding protein